MEHVVFYPGPDGSPSFQRAGSLDEAVAAVERLRNIDGVSDVTVFALTEVPLAFRPYYRVEVPGAAGAPAAPEPVAAPQPVAAPEPVALTEAEPEPAPEPESPADLEASAAPEPFAVEVPAPPAPPKLEVVPDVPQLAEVPPVDVPPSDIPPVEVPGLAADAPDATSNGHREGPRGLGLFVPQS